MEVLFGLLVASFMCFVFFSQIHENNRLVIAKFRFKFFALRDRLSLLACFHDLDENSWEYKETICSLNFHISATERVSFMRVIAMLADFHTSKDAEVEVLSRSVHREDVREVLSDFMATAYDLLSRNARAQIRSIKFAALFLRSVSRRRPSMNARTVVLNPCHALNAIRTHSETLKTA